MYCPDCEVVTHDHCALCGSKGEVVRRSTKDKQGRVMYWLVCAKCEKDIARMHNNG